MVLARRIGEQPGRPGPGPGRRRRRGLVGPDRLECRELRARGVVDLAVLSSSTSDSRAVDVSYEVRGLAEGDRRQIELALYRSADDRFDEEEDHRVGSARFVVEGEGDGSAALRRTAQVVAPDGLKPTPSRPFVLAVADPSGELDEADTSDNVAGFRKRVIGVVTHGGIQGSSSPPEWASILSESLREVGYDAVMTFTWAGESNTPGAAPKQGARLANLLLHTSTLFPWDEPVDLHLIGHSQGTVVNSSALLALERVTTPQLDAGFVRQTMLDPHAASNGAPGQASFTPGLEGWIARQATSAYQWMSGDPMVTVPLFVDEAEVYYQHTPAGLDGLPWSHNFWGQAPVVGRARYRDLTGPGMSHTGPTGVQTWYFKNVVPTLAEGGVFVNPSAITGRLVASPGDRTSGDLTRTAVASPAYTGTAAPGGTVRLLTQTVPGGPFLLLDEETVDAEGSWALSADDLPRGHYRMLVRGVVPAGIGPWTEFYPLLPLGRLAVRPGLDTLPGEQLDRLDRVGSTDPPPTRRSEDGPKGLPAPVPDRLADRAARPPDAFELSPGRERLLSRMAERLLTDRGRAG
jgi:hypothetical protein